MTKIPTDPEERKAYFRALASKGGQASAKSPISPRPFRDIPGLAKKAGSIKGYKFKRIPVKVVAQEKGEIDEKAKKTVSEVSDQEA